ncbi:DNA polymerase IV [Aerococcus kribbianus]|uniref:DNA polymerase IV n=1 Tax=Aerococcus kribbianus TaxID=2999064 RepID=A0A9X3FP36_9LACT|nr:MULTISPECIES: DNA polymerase IV [unclassified Aerococcus]MCZ0717121.1 DNA polymerase IV [Aerococcus sp. YH-aer221]MCZ0725409.1 DNA polymerase IV [Aerococcus sp. YH-aer222]
MRTIGMLRFDDPQIDGSRKILHVDMDAFYASIEQRDHPEYRGKPIIIARHPKENSGKGVVATASYEARKYGVHSAMAAQEAYERCPQAIFVASNHSYYQEVSRQVREIFFRYTDQVEPLSIDEAFLDVTHNKQGLPYAMDIAKAIQKAIYQELQLTCSIGVSYNKFIAKLASDYNKPFGMTVITPKRAPAFLEGLPIEKFYGIGQRSVAKLHDQGIYTGADLKALSQDQCLTLFGKTGLAIYERVRGVDNRLVKTVRQRKSLGKETTFYPFLYHDEEVEAVLRELAQSVAKSLAKHGVHGKVVTLKLRYGDFNTMTRQQSLHDPIKDSDSIYFYALDLFRDYGEASQGVRLLGITLSDLTDVDFENMQLPLYPRLSD